MKRSARIETLTTGGMEFERARRGDERPGGQDDNGGSSQINSWRIAYTIGGVRDWQFAQHKRGILA